MKALFVDDEVRVLEALERVLLDLEPTWELRFVATGELALAELQQQSFDVIVCDLRLAGIDGVALLRRVRELYPRMVRIVLSGHTDELAALKIVRFAHQVLAKPCAAETLHQVIARTAALNRVLGDRRLQALVGQVGTLASPAHLHGALVRLLQADDVATLPVVDLVKQDPAMTCKLLQVANSAFFNSAASVADVETAIMRIGFRALRTLALGDIAFEAAPGAPNTVGFVEQLQLRAVAVARLAARMVSLPEDAASAYMAGLLSDVGQLLLASVAPERLYVAQAEAVRAGVATHVSERATWGTTHAEIGAYLLGLWGLPFQIVEAVANHHAPERQVGDRLGLPQVVWLAACIVEGNEPRADVLHRFGAEELYAKHRFPRR